MVQVFIYRLIYDYFKLIILGVYSLCYQEEYALIGVIIQGPLITFGQGPNNSIEGFNSYYTITENIKAINRLGFNYIISTWNANNSDELTIIKQLNDKNPGKWSLI